MLFGKTLQCCYPLHLPKTQLHRLIELADEAGSLATHRLSLVQGRAPSHVHLGVSAQDRPKAGQKEQLQLCINLGKLTCLSFVLKATHCTTEVNPTQTGYKKERCYARFKHKL